MVTLLQFGWPQTRDHEHHYARKDRKPFRAVRNIAFTRDCGWIIYEAIQRLFFKEAHVEASIWHSVVMAISIFIDYNRSRILYAAARKHNSQALEADACTSKPTSGVQAWSFLA